MRLAVLLLIAAAAVAGERAVHVVDVGGAPASGTLLLLTTGEVVEVALDAQGRAPVPDDVQDGVVFARAGDRCTALVTLEDAVESTALRLDTGGALDVEVGGEAGATPGIGVAVLIELGGLRTPPFFETVTDGRGRAVIEGLPVGVPVIPIAVSASGGALLRRAEGGTVTIAKAGDRYSVRLAFEPTRGRVVRYRVECETPPESASDLTVADPGTDPSLTLDRPAKSYPLDLALFVPDACPPLVFRCDFGESERFAVDMAPSTGEPRRTITLAPPPRLLVRVLDAAGEPVWGGAWHVRAWILEGGKPRFYPPPESDREGELHAIALPWPLPLLGSEGRSLRFELRAGADRRGPFLPSREEADGDCDGRELLRRMSAEPAPPFHVELSVPLVSVPKIVVRDPGGVPIADAEVELLDEDGTVAVGTSGTNGVVSFVEVPVGAAPSSARAAGDLFGSVYAEGGFRGTAPVPLVAHRTRSVEITLRTAEGPLGLGADLEVSAVIDAAGERTHWEDESKADERGVVTMRIPFDVSSLELRAGREFEPAALALPRESRRLDVVLVRRAIVQLLLGDALRISGVVAIDPRTGERFSPYYSSSDGRVEVWLTPRPTRLAVDYGERTGSAEWDGVAASIPVDFAERARSRVRIILEGEDGSPLPACAVLMDVGDERSSRTVETTTDAVGALEIEVCHGWVQLSPTRTDRPDMDWRQPVRFVAPPDSPCRVRLLWSQRVRLALPARPGDRRAEWRDARGAWTRIEYAPWREASDPEGTWRIAFEPGVKPFRAAVRFAGVEREFDYPGRPVEPPLLSFRER